MIFQVLIDDYPMCGGHLNEPFQGTPRYFYDWVNIGTYWSPSISDLILKRYGYLKDSQIDLLIDGIRYTKPVKSKQEQ